MRVLITSGLFYPAKLGGPANTLYWLSKALVAKGIDVSVVVTNHTIDQKEIIFDKWTTIDGIRVQYCSKKSPIGFRQIIRAKREMKLCDIVLLSSICYIPNFFICLFAISKGKKVIWSPRGELISINGRKDKKIFFKWVNKYIAKHVIFHSTSEEEKQSVDLFFPNAKDSVIIPNYFEIPNKENRQESKDKYFLYMGRLSPIKALDNLIIGLSLSKFKNSEYKMLIVGPNQNDYKSTLISIAKQHAIESQIVFKDSIFDKEKYQCYANAQFSFLVSHTENFGNVVIESLSQGTPAVASFGTPWKVLEETNSGFWINNSPESIATCFNTILSLSEEMYQKYRDNSIELAKRFDVFENIDKWINLFVHETSSGCVRSCVDA